MQTGSPPKCSINPLWTALNLFTAAFFINQYVCSDFFVLIIIDGGSGNSSISFCCSAKVLSSISTNWAFMRLISLSLWPPLFTTKNTPLFFALCSRKIDSSPINFPASTEYFFPANMPSFLSSNIRMFTISSGLNKLFIISCAVIFICLPPS